MAATVRFCGVAEHHFGGEGDLLFAWSESGFPSGVADSDGLHVEVGADVIEEITLLDSDYFDDYDTA